MLRFSKRAGPFPYRFSLASVLDDSASNRPCQAASGPVVRGCGVRVGLRACLRAANAADGGLSRISFFAKKLPTCRKKIFYFQRYNLDFPFFL